MSRLMFSDRERRTLGAALPTARDRQVDVFAYLSEQKAIAGKSLEYESVRQTAGAEGRE